MSVRSFRRSNARCRARAARRATALAIGSGALLATPAQAANFVVNSTGDAPANACDAACTLRDAVEAADANGAGSDEITFAPSVTGQITLTAGELDIDEAVSITGPGAGVLAVSGDANGDDVAAAPDSQIAFIVASPVTISGLTMTEGLGGLGGAVQLIGNLTLDHVTITDSRAESGDHGGAVYFQGALTVANSTFSGNRSVLGSGGAIGAGAGSLTVRDSSFTDNRALHHGGAIYVSSDTDDVLIAGSTIGGGNRADEFGGGIYLKGPEWEQAVIRRSTISGNVASAGGGITSRDISSYGVRIEGSTIAGNYASYAGGGVYMRRLSDEPIELSSSIVADNIAAFTGEGDLGERRYTPPALQGHFTLSNSLVEVPGAATVVQAPVGSNILGVDPALGPLASNGGPTQTMLLGPSSPAIDAGVSNGLSTDQRGFARTADAAAVNPPGADGTDIGAVEMRVAAVTIDSGPNGPTTDVTPSFGFSSPAATSLECRMDGGAFASCAAPFVAGVLDDGPHTFEARAISVDGVAGPAASRSFVVDSTVSGAKVSGKSTQRQRGSGIKVEIELDAGEPATAVLSGVIRVGKRKYALKGLTTKLSGGKRVTVTLKPKGGKAARRIADAVDAGEKVAAAVDVEFTDELRNAVTKSKFYKLK